MAESYVWIAQGYAVSDNMNITLEQFLNQTDQALLNLIFPSIDDFVKQNLIIQWYTSRAWDKNRGITPRVRIYIKLDNSKTEIVRQLLKNISEMGDLKMVEVVPPSTDQYPDSHYKIIQKSSDIAKNLLPKALRGNRYEETYLKEIDMIIDNNPDIKNEAGIHWLENNLGYETNFLCKRYNLSW